MCGFAGMTYHDRKKLENMAAPISIRARDKEVFFGIDNELSFYHAPLKISDLDKDTNQPFVTEGIII